MGLRVDINKGLVLLVAAPYDETIVDWIRRLPERRYRHGPHDWIVPARREHLRTLCSVVGELEERGTEVEITARADARLARVDVGRAMLRAGAIEIAGPYSERRLPALRALPERCFDAERKIWRVPLTRAGATAILALADGSNELVITQRAGRALQQSATATAAAQGTALDTDAPPEPRRRSPIAHWRHYTAGPVFDNPARPRLDVPGIGLCVRIRVDPGRRSDANPSRRALSGERSSPLEQRHGST